MQVIYRGYTMQSCYFLIVFWRLLVACYWKLEKYLQRRNLRSLIRCLRID
jgi:hypothetical protein